MDYNEADFVEYALTQMNIKILKRAGNLFELEGNFAIEVENRDLYRLSNEGWVISPFDDIGTLCNFIKTNINHSLTD